MGGILLEGMYDVYSEQSDSRSASTSQEGAGRGGERNSLIWTGQASCSPPVITGEEVLFLHQGFNLWAFRLTRSARVRGGPAVCDTHITNRKYSRFCFDFTDHSQGNGIEFVNTPSEGTIQHITTGFTHLLLYAVSVFSSFFFAFLNLLPLLLSTPQVYQRHNSHY